MWRSPVWIARTTSSVRVSAANLLSRALEVELHRRLGDLQTVGDGAIGKTFGDQTEYLQLARRKRIQR